jgi:cytochrome c oxidase subunit 4
LKEVRVSTHVVPVRTYYLVFAALIILTVTTVGLDLWVHLGPLHTAASLLIAVIKSILVILFFMHVLYSSRLTWVFACAGVFFLAILIGYTLQDYMTRVNWPVSPGQ